MKSLVLASLTIIATMGMASAQDLAAGEQSFRKCSPLPFGRRRRAQQGRAGAQRPRGPQVRHRCRLQLQRGPTTSAEITWSEASFKDYIQNPMTKVPGTKMAFAGIKNDKEITDLWAYLKQFKADGSK